MAVRLRKLSFAATIQTAAVCTVFAAALCGMHSVAIAEKATASSAPKPLVSAHSHNDYLHRRPLFDALDHGFTSVEADVFAVDGELLVGHERGDLTPDRTLEKLYLAPLSDRVKANGGSVYPTPSRFFLLIDFKSDATTASRLLQPLLKNYRRMLTASDDAKSHAGPVTVVITGNRPEFPTGPQRKQGSIDPDSVHKYAGIDGRVSDLASNLSPEIMPMISDNWKDHFKWYGDGPMPSAEQEKLRDIVRKAHDSGRVVRFWSTRDSESFWRELESAGVDLINADNLDRLAEFLSKSRSSEFASPK